jgi:hypothetical protein
MNWSTPTGSLTLVIAISPARTSPSLNRTVAASPRAARPVQAPAKQSACCSVVIVGSARSSAADALLDGVGELVGEHGADRGGAVLAGQFGEQTVLAVVVHDEVADPAVEGHVLLHVLVGRPRCAAAGDVVGPIRMGGVDVTLQRSERPAVDRRVRLRPPQFDVGHHRQQEVVVCTRRLVRTEVDRRAVDIGRRWRRCRRGGRAGLLRRRRTERRVVAEAADGIGAFAGDLDAARTRAQRHGARGGQGEQPRALHAPDATHRTPSTGGGRWVLTMFSRRVVRMERAVASQFVSERGWTVTVGAPMLRLRPLGPSGAGRGGG